MENKADLLVTSSLYNLDNTVSIQGADKMEKQKHIVSSFSQLNGEELSKTNEISSLSISEHKENEPKLAKSFPWLTEFVKMCRAEIGVTSISTLENLMTIYLQNVGTAIVECYVKPNRAAKLKKCMNDTLVLFHMLYSDIKKPLEHSSYLDKMSDLLAYYIDMEIKASRRGKESLPKIASKLTSSLYLFLDHSIDHILDAILKTKNMTKNFCELCTFIFRRVLKEGVGRTVYEMTYVRYILVFKMWKRVVKGAEERRKVMKLASTTLIPPSQFREKLKSGLLCGVLPKIPKSRPDITMFLMQAKFCVKDKSKEFLKVVADPKQQCVLGPSLSADLDRPLFFGDGDDSPDNSNSDDQEDTSGSSVLMNDIWSSMTLEAGLRDHLRLAEVTVTKPKKSSKCKVKKKGKSNSVVERVKNKKKSKKESENKSVEDNKCSVEAKEKCSGETKEKSVVQEVKPPIVHSNSSEVSENCTQTTTEEHNTKENYESAPLIPIENIKVESDLDDVCFVGIIRKGDDLITDTEKDTEIMNVSRDVEIRNDTDSVKIERPGQVTTTQLSTQLSSHQHDIFLYEQPPPEWSPAPSQNFFNNAVCDFINGYLPDFDIETAKADLDNRDIYDMLDVGKTLQNRHKEMFPMTNDNVLNQLPVEEDVRNIGLDVSSTTATNNDNITASIGGNVTLANDDNATVINQDENQEKIDDMIESFREQVHYTEKNSETNIANNSVSNINNEVEIKSNDKGVLHGITLRSDHSIFVSQQQFRSLYITEVMPPSVPVPSPPKIDSSSRCDCDQCNANYEALRTNYKKLTEYKNSKMNNANSTYKKTTTQQQQQQQQQQKQDDELVKTNDEELEPGKSNSRQVEQHSSLPLKKRKAVQPSHATTAAILKKENLETSYPCTPMMSIAVALEKSKIGIQPSSTTALTSKTLTTPCVTVSTEYSTTSNNIQQQYTYNTSVNSVTSSIVPSAYNNSTITAVYNSTGSVIVQGQTQNTTTIIPNKNNKTISTKSSLTNNTLKSSFQRSFKTPAQLKEGISVLPTDLKAAQDLINFAQNSHNYYNKQTTDKKSNKRTRNRTKTDRHHSKKKKN